MPATARRAIGLLEERGLRHRRLGRKRSSWTTSAGKISSSTVVVGIEAEATEYVGKGRTMVVLTPMLFNQSHDTHNSKLPSS
jgi:hypothetical protein